MAFLIDPATGQPMIDPTTGFPVVDPNSTIPNPSSNPPSTISTFASSFADLAKSVVTAYDQIVTIQNKSKMPASASVAFTPSGFSLSGNNVLLLGIGAIALLLLVRK